MTHGIGAVPVALLGIVVVDEADATTAYFLVGLDHAFHDVYHLLWLVKTVFDDGSRVDGSNVDVRRDAANLFVFALYKAFADFVSAYKSHPVAEHE